MEMECNAVIDVECAYKISPQEKGMYIMETKHPEIQQNW